MSLILFCLLVFFRLIGCHNQLIFVKYDSGLRTLTSTGQIKMADEINSIDINEKRTLAACVDDTGLLSIVELKTRKVMKVSAGSFNITIMSSRCFSSCKVSLQCKLFVILAATRS